MRRLICLGVLGLTMAAPSVRADEREEFFETKIRPVLVSTCLRCHGDAKTSGSLRIDSRLTLLKGGESGPAIVPGKAEESLLIQAIQRREGVTAMPPGKEKALRADQVADFVEWVKAGAVWPEKSAKLEAAKHWAFEAVKDVALPAVQDKAWGRTGVDAFIRARQEAASVRPAPMADKLTLIRRATFDLTGLPPTPDEIDAFVQDSSPRAFEVVVDRLLKSPAYGERWGRHWLDVVRYADTAGETADYPVPLAWRYRNYVIDAFNADMPYDQFLREQIAGDVLANQGAAKGESQDQYARQVTATGYLAISRRFGFDSENYHHLTIQDTIDTLGQSVLGLGLGCARCHDHKFDPLSTADYYALYGIFDSSRYPFPGSEQKPRVRSMAPLVAPAESQVKWRSFETKIAALGEKLAKQKQPSPNAMLRSLHELDGDFELQAPAAGGSNGVLVPPWVYDGKVAVAGSAQSPFKNLHPSGKVGAMVAARAGEYRITQAIHPRRSRDNGDVLHVNLDFRMGASDANVNGAHRFLLGAYGETPAIEVLITSDALSLRLGEKVERLGGLKPNQWHNLQLALDLKGRTVQGSIGTADTMTRFDARPFSQDSSGVIDIVVLDSQGQAEGERPAIDFDNFGVQETPIPPTATESPAIVAAVDGPDPAVLAQKLQALTQIDGDLELQLKDKPPASPWGPGPNSVVRLSSGAQSPYCNLFPPGELGLHMPNRGEYDGVIVKLGAVQPDKDNHLFVSFDFRCANKDAGGDGSWRYYIGHGPGASAAVELFMTGSEFFARSADTRQSVSPLVIGQWYQVQLTLDLKARSFTGVLAWREGRKAFEGQLATGWDGAIDTSFIDSYGHIGGVRPSLDADNFVVSDKPLAALDAPAVKVAAGSKTTRQAIMELRQQLAAIQTDSEQLKQELNSLVADGPFEMTYGMAEGTPHNVRIQLRGEPDQLGPPVERGFIKVLGGSSLSARTFGSGRLELAQWLTRPENPLTARVMVNRIWQYHFGRGLVGTPNNFGARGMPPTHPQLLDHLAMQFVRSGWSVKAMHRLIMLSATYQQASVAEPADRPGHSDLGKDAVSDADLYGSFSRRRLGAEEIRDSILAVSGELDRVPGQEHPFPTPISWGYSQHGPFSAVYDHNKRSIYLMTQRLKRHPFLALFDGADPNSTTPDRLKTTVPTQALFFLNDPFIHTKSDKWAARLQSAATSDVERIDQAWRRALGCLPTEIERAEATAFLAAYRSEATAMKLDNVETRSLAALLRTLFGSNKFLHVD